MEAIDITNQGDVIVIYNGSHHVTPWGELAALSCINKGIAGVLFRMNGDTRLQGVRSRLKKTSAGYATR